MLNEMNAERERVIFGTRNFGLSPAKYSRAKRCPFTPIFVNPIFVFQISPDLFLFHFIFPNPIWFTLNMLKILSSVRFLFGF